MALIVCRQHRKCDEEEGEFFAKKREKNTDTKMGMSGSLHLIHYLTLNGRATGGLGLA